MLGSLVTANAMFSRPDDGVDRERTYAENRLYYYVKQSNKNLTDQDAKDIAVSLNTWASTHNLDLSLVTAVAQVESGFDKHAISSTGAMGLMQVIPSWHLTKLKAAKKELKSPELFSVNTNVYVGTWVLNDCISKHKNVNTALLCYNGSAGKPNGYDKKVIAAKRDIEKFIKNS